MHKTSSLALFLAAALAAAATPTRADVWDLADDDDDTATSTDTSIAHGVEQVHDLAAAEGAPDVDFYGILSVGRSSYEVLIDNTTGDLNLGTDDITRLDKPGRPLQSAQSTEGIEALRWENTTAAAEINFVRVGGATCTTNCTEADQYRIRVHETTYSVPRFNNSGGQVTVLSLATIAAFSCQFSLHFYQGNGEFLGTVPGSFLGKEQVTFNTSTFDFAAGKSGWIGVAHTCGYGGLTGKAVALELATGFTFDTPLLPRI